MENNTKLMADAIKRTQNGNEPLKDTARFIIETNEDSPKVIAVIAANDYEVADGYVIREKPIYEEKQMAFYQAKPKDQVIKNLKKEGNELFQKRINIDTILLNDTNISQRQLDYMRIQKSIMESLATVIDARIKDLKENK